MSEETQKVGGKAGNIFRAIGKFIIRHKKLFIFLAVVIIIVAIVIALLPGSGANAAAGYQVPQTTALARMDLQQVVSGTGTLQSSVTREVTSSLSYEVLEIYVKEGDKVQAGQLLAQLDTTELDKTIANTRESISDAVASDALALSQAERKLQDAIDTRDINWSKNDATVQDADSVLGTANANLAAANSSLQAAEAVVSAKQDRLASVQADYDAWASSSIGANPHEGARADAQVALQTAQGELAGVQQTQAAAASAASAAQTTYDKAVETRDTQYRSDSISVENAQDSVNTQKLKDSAATYRTQLDGYLDDLEDCTITAPIAGTITAMTAEIGQSAGGGSMGVTTTSAVTSGLFTIEDTNRLEITSSIPEYDMVNIRTGMQVQITTDALTDGEWLGAVKSISTKAADTNGNFTVVVEVTSAVGDLAIGMSAKINIVTESKNDVFAVPYDAVTTNEQGESVVYILSPDAASMPASQGIPMQAGSSADGSSPAQAGIMGQPVVVKTGMETDYYIEIISNELAEGDLVLTDPEGKNVTTTTTGIMGGMGGGMMGG